MNQSSTSAPTAAALLSNGRYFTHVTAAGTGQSRRHGHIANRWLGDPVEDGHGQFIYLRDLETATCWSVGRQPVPCASTRYQASATPGQFHIDHEAHEVAARLDIAVAPGDDVELRRLTLTNNSARPRSIEVTSYFEAVLNWQAADIGHPAFSKLFLQTDYLAEIALLTVDRRPRSNSEHWPTLFHGLYGAAPTEWETDRLRFLGRGCTAASPAALRTPLSGTVGNVLDPCCALRTVISLQPGGTATVTFVTGIAETREAARETARRLGAPQAADSVFADAENAELEFRKQLGITSQQAEQFQALAAAMLASDRSLKPAVDALPARLDANAAFGRLGIPRDRMLIMARAGWRSPATLEARRARDYFNHYGFFTNLLVLDEDKGLQPAGLDDRVFTTDGARLTADEKQLLLVASSMVVDSHLPNIACDWSPSAPPQLKSATFPETKTRQPESLEYSNGFGGFSSDGREYVMQLSGTIANRHWPPLPWVNVIANEHAGFLVSESGSGCTWARNSQANRITPWSNEPVSDPHGEALYLRDEETGSLFSPFPGPLENSISYVIRHGLGYTTVESTAGTLRQEATLFVPRDHSVKITLLKLTNAGPAPKRLSITAYQQLVMGAVPTSPSLIVTRRTPGQDLHAVNLAAGDFKGATAFSSLTVHGAAASEPQFTCDRQSFLGRYGNPGNPQSLRAGTSLDGRSGAGLDPCFVQQQAFTIDPGATVECVILLGEAMTDSAAGKITSLYRDPAAARESLEQVKTAWNSALDRVQVETPSKKLNVLVNAWLPYQTLGCRLWARSGFYQSSGAFGFRDQLQDAGNLIAIEPRLTREQILLHARHQFVEGDVLHWWHAEPIGRGLRTKFSDDLLWLPFITAGYVQATGDAEILDRSIPFIKGPPLHDGEDEVYITPEPAGIEASLYEHCCRTIDRSLAVGSHGLPLMGCGDWNDGMNRVGREGRGESVWLGFFLFKILGDFIPYCQQRSDGRARQYSEHRERLRAALNEGGWDGEWYRRAYYDNGDPLGSKQNDECRIDAIAQAWAVISGAAPPDRARSCLAAMTRELISEQDGIIRLLAPPFVKTPNDPGYIKGYVAGIRENGGQYTHAACWAVMAKALHGENESALRLWEMLTPISHTETEQKASHYKGEPYCYPGDVYGAAPHVGRCGWTWYTGSSGWMYRVALESILGIQVENGDTLVVAPCVPDDWPSYRVVLTSPRRPDQGGSGRLVIQVENPRRSARTIVAAESDGTPIPAQGRSVRVPIHITGGDQQVRIVLGER